MSFPSRHIHIFIFFIILMPFWSLGQSAIVLTDSSEQYSIAYDNLSVYTDFSNELSISQISKPEFQSKFKQNKIQLPRNTQTEATYWLRFKILNLSNAEKSWLFEYFDSSIEDLIFYVPKENGKYIAYQSGTKFPFHSKIYKHKNFEFQIPSVKNQELTFFARIRSSHLVFMYGVVRSYNKFIAYALNEYYFLGIFYGIILAMAIYNLLLFLSVKDKIYLFYALYALSSGFLCMVMDGTGFEFIWGAFPQFNPKAYQLATFFMVIWAILYTQSFVIIKGNNKVHFNLLELLIVFRIVIFILSISILPFLSDFILIDFIALLLCYISGIVSYLSGNLATRYFILGFTFLFLGFIISNLTVHSVFGFSLPNNVFNVYSFNFSIVIEMILLSFALAERIRLVIKERSEALTQSISYLQTNDDLKEKLNKELEQKVRERTFEINAQKHQLETKNQELESLYSELNQNIEVAKLIQLSILPPEELIKKHLPNSYILYLPKDVVSGDFYWFEYRFNKIYIAAVDCTGHGVAGAFMSLIGYNILNQLVRDPQNEHLNAGDLLDKLNINVIDSLRQNSKSGLSRDGMDINLCIIDLNSNTLNYAGAVNYLYIIRNNELIKLVADPFSIGIPRSGDINKFTNHVFDLQPNDLLIQYTDGYADQLGGSGDQKKFLYNQFRSLFIEICNLPLPEQEKVLRNRFSEWKGSNEQTDDILVMGLKI